MPAFISTWKTDNPGTSNADQITLPLVSGGTYNFTVQWGDGSSDTITAYNDAAVTHTYATAGTYTVEITGTISGWRFADGGDKDKILDVSQWGDLAFGSTNEQFNGCSNLAVTATDAPDLTGTVSLENCFRDSGITSANLNAWDVSGVMNMRLMFRSSPFNGDISAWNVSSVTDMGFMFYISPFNGDVSAWNVSSVTNMTWMFRGTPFNGDVSAWDVSSVTDMMAMFRGIPFNGDVSAWDVSSVTTMRDMFRDTPFNGDVSAWDVSSVTDMRDVFNGSSFSDENYSRALIAWSRLPLQTGVTWSNTSAEYYAGAAAEARAEIATDFGWTISDNGEAAETSYAVVGEVLDGTTPLTGEPVVWTSEQDVELDAVTSAFYGEQAGRYALMTTDAITFPNASDVNGTTVTLEETTFIYEQDVGVVSAAPALSVTTLPETDLASTSVTLNGELTELDTSADVYFEYREAGAAEWTSTTAQTLTAVGTFSEGLTGLTHSTEYEYRAVATEGGETVTGDPVSFTTDPLVTATFQGAATDNVGAVVGASADLLDDADEPIAGATATTDASGDYSIPGVELEEGVYTLRFTDSNYVTQDVSVTVSAGTTTYTNDVTLVLADGIITGIAEINGVGVADSGTMYAYAQSDPTLAGTSASIASDGRYYLTGLTAGGDYFTGGVTSNNGTDYYPQYRPRTASGGA